MSIPVRHILVVDDNPSIHEDFRKIFSGLQHENAVLDASDALLFGTTPLRPNISYELDYASQGREALELVRAAVANNKPYSLAFLDVQMPPGWDGVQTMAEIWKVAPDLHIVLCTAFSNYTINEIQKVGRTDQVVVLKKPFDPIEVLQMANVFSEKWQLLTELRERAGKLEESQHRYEFLAEATPGLLWTATANGNVEYFNARWTDYTGLTMKQSINWSWQAVVHPEDLPGCVATWTHALRTGENYEVEYRLKRADGAYRWFLGRARPMRNEQGSIVHWVGTCTDIDDKKRAEKELQQSNASLEKRVAERTLELTRSEQLLRTIMDILPHGVFWKDREGRILGANNQFQRDIGVTDVIGKTDYELTARREQADAFRSDDLQVMQSGQPKLNIEEHLSDAAGQTLWLNTSKVPMFNSAGEITGVLGTYLNITERKRVDEALRKSEARYRELINCQAEGVVYSDGDLKFTFANPAAESILGVWPGQLIGKTFYDFLDEKNQAVARQQNKLRLTGEKSSYEIVITTPQGARRQLLITGAPQVDANGKVCGTFAVFRDITDRRSAELAVRESQRLLRAVLDNIPDPAWLKDAQGRYLVGNKPLARLYNRRLDEIVGSTDFSAFPGDASTRTGIHNGNGPDQIIRTEVSIEGEQGQSRWFDTIETPILNTEGQLVSTVGLARDITERKQMETALRESENRHRELLDSQDDGVGTTDAAVAFTFANPALGKILGLPSDKLIGRNLREFVVIDQQALLEQEIKQRKSGKKSSYEIEITRPDGEHRQVHITATPKLDASGAYCGTFAVFRDITERKQTEEKLHLQTSALVATANGIVIYDRAGTILWVNPAFTRLTGYTSEEAIGRDSRLLKSGKHSPEFYANIWKTVLVGKTWQGELINRRKDGTEYHEETFITPVLDERGGIKHFVSVKQDISSRKSAEAQLLTREEAFRALADNVPDAVARIDRQFRFAYGNRALSAEIGCEPSEIAGKTGVELHLPESARRLEEIRRVFETGVPRTFEFHWQGPEGMCYRESRLVPEFSASGEVEFVLAMTRDVTEQRNLEKERSLMDVQLRQAQKMEAVGQLAAGIAHEINTPTQYVGDNTKFLKDAFVHLTSALKGYTDLIAAAKLGPLSPEVIADAEKILATSDLDYHIEQIPAAINETLEGVARVAKIVRAMKEFSHPGGKEKTAADINRAIDSTTTVARNEWKYVADLVLDLDPNLPPVPCFISEFNQAILNLVVNAAHAIGDAIRAHPGKKGTITISTQRDGDSVVVRVSDTGTGIPEAHRQKIFEPFFTTKDVGKGTGQGLTVVYSSIVKKHEGTVTFETATGKGTTFILRLPLTSKTAPALAAPEAPRELSHVPNAAVTVTP